MVFSCRIVLLGDGGVGKSCVAVRLTQDSFVTEYDPTIENNYKKQLTVDDEETMLDILDTAGQEDYSILRDTYIRQGQGFVIVYSIISKASFDSIEETRNKILSVKDKDKVPMVIIGNKADLEESRQVTTQAGQQLAEKFGCPFYETSALTNVNIVETFQQLVREIKAYKEDTEEDSGTFKQLTDNHKNKKEKKGVCVLI